MLYGFRKSDDSLVVVAADSIEEYNEFLDLHTNLQTDLISDHLMGEYSSYRKPLVVFASGTNQPQVVVLNTAQSIEKQSNMESDDAVLIGYSKSDLSDRRLIGDIYGISENDQWDKRTQEEKDAHQKQSQMASKIRDRMKDAMSGNSWDPTINKKKKGIQITGISQDANGNISVSGIKNGESNPDEIHIEDVIDDVFNRTQKTQITLQDFQTQLVELEKLEFESLDEWKKDYEMIFSKNIINDKELVDGKEVKTNSNGQYVYKSNGRFVKKQDLEKLEKILSTDIQKQVDAMYNKAHRSIVAKTIKNTVDPVKANSLEDAMKVYEDRFSKIPNVSTQNIEDLKKYVEDSLNNPLPDPSQFEIVLNQAWTDSSAMRGEGTPIIHVFPQDGIDKFEETSLMEVYGLECVSGNTYSFEKEPGDDLYTTDIMSKLKSAGFVENPAKLPQAIKRKLQPNTTITPQDVADALAGDGSSSVVGDGTKKIGQSAYERIKDMTAGVVGPIGITQNQDSSMNSMEWDDVPVEIRKLLNPVLSEKEKSQIMLGNHNGSAIGSVFPIVVSGSWKQEASINIRHIGTTVNDGSSVVMVSVANKIAPGIFVAIEPSVTKIYVLTDSDNKMASTIKQTQSIDDSHTAKAKNDKSDGGNKK